MTPTRTQGTALPTLILCCALLLASSFAAADVIAQADRHLAKQPLTQLTVGNPINYGTGGKVQRETDYRGAFAEQPLLFTRSYSSFNLVTPVSTLGRHWLSNYDRTVVLDEDDPNNPVATVYRGDGRAYDFAWDDTGETWSPDADVKDRLIELLDNGTRVGWEYRPTDNSVEVYDADGRLTTITNPQGFSLTLSYDGNDQLEAVSDTFGRSLTFSYDTDGRLATLTDPAGGVYSYDYDEDDNLISVTYPGDDPQDLPTRVYHYEDPNYPHALTGITDETGERYATYAYNENGHAVLSEHAGGAERVEVEYHPDGSATVTDALGNIRTYTFEVIHGVVKVSDVSGPCPSCAGQAQSYTYDADGFIASKTDFNGNTTTYQHNARGLETSRTEAAGTPEARTITTDWHADFRLPVSITEPGRETTMTYDSAGRLLTRTETDTATNDTRTTTFTYYGEDPNDDPLLTGLLKSVDGPRTDVTDITTFEYDSQGNRTHITNALNQVTQITAHDAHGRPLVIEDPNGTVTTLAYDPRGRLVSRTTDNQTTTFDYDAVGNLIEVTLPTGTQILNSYDAARRLIAVEDTLGNRIDYTLDPMGNRIEEAVSDSSQVLRRTLTRTYDELSRLIESIGGEGQTTTYAYDANGNPVEITDPRNHITTQAFDALNRLIETEDALEGVTIFSYDARDNLASVTDPRGLTTTYTYDGLNNLIEQESPDTGLTGYTYDEAGNRVSQTDARNVTTSYSYDAINRLTQISYPDTSLDVTFSYDSCTNGIGRLCVMVDGSGETQYAYDARGNLVTQSVTIGTVTRTIEYAYDVADQLVQVTYPSGRTVDYDRNVLGQVIEISTTSPDGLTTEVLADNLDYLPFGPMASMTYGNGIPMTRNFDLDYRLTQQSAGSIQSLSWTYDATDNITALTDGVNTGRSQGFDYDALNRLTQAQGAYGNQAFDYDPVGNRTQLIADSHTETYTYAVDSQQLESLTNGATMTYDYDAVGNTTDNTTHGFVYGDHNRMTQATVAGSPVAEYVYNGRGERVKKQAQSTTLFFYDLNGQLIAETDDTGVTVKEYLYLDGIPLAMISEETGGSGSGGEPIDLVIDNTDPQVTFVGDWPTSTVVSGFEGPNYQHHFANGPSPDGIVIDNEDPGFSVTGEWPTSTVVGGYLGTNYQHHYANGPSPDANVIDNQDAGFSTEGNWPTSTAVSGYQGANYQHHTAGDGSRSATWTFNVTEAGDYHIGAKWTQHPNRASNAPYTITHSGGSQTVTVNQKQNGGTFQTLTTLNLQPGTVTVTLTNDADGYVIADAASLVPVDAEPNTATWTFQVSETGNYEVQARWTQHPNRATNAPYTVTHENGADTITVNQQANGGSFQTLGTYSFTQGQTYTVELTDQADGYVIADAIQVVPENGGPNRAVWQPNLTGEVEILARWTSHNNRATNAPYIISHAGGTDTITVNQQANGGQYVSLGTWTLDANSTVTLTDEADGYVIADALRFVGETTGAPEPVQGGIFYVHTDHLGTPQKLTDSNQALVWDAVYEPFGQVTIQTELVTFNPRFPGQYFDQETGLHYNYFRDYDPTIGRYVQSDPIGLMGGINTYVYVNGNPLFWTDPLGLYPNCFRGLPRVSVSTNTVFDEEILHSFRMVHPENYRPSAGGNFPPSSSRPPIGPEVAVDWWVWEHTLKEISEYEITKTITVTTIWCEEERDCKTFRWNYDDVNEKETKRLNDQIQQWFHRKLYKAGSNSWPLPLP